MTAGQAARFFVVSALLFQGSESTVTAQTADSKGASQLQVGPLALTRAMCPPGSLHDHIVKQLPFIRSYVIRDGHLFLSLMADGGIYEFEPLGRKPAGAAGAQSIQGTATYRERIALPPDAVFEATLEDVSRKDAPAEVIGRARVASPGNPPIRFEIRYDATRIQPTRTYVVRGRIVVGEKLMFTTDTSPPVLTTRGSGTTVSLTMRIAGSGTTTQGAQAATGLEGSVWRLVRLRGLADQTLAALTRPATVRFDAGRLQAFNGCNSLTGAYSTSGERVTLGTLAGTMMACVGQAATIEAAFNKALTGTLRFRVAARELTLMTEAETIPALVFSAEPSPVLEGIAWEITGLDNGRQGVAGPLAGTRLTVLFQKRSVSGLAGCNSFTGKYTRQENKLTIGPLAATRKACTGPGVMDQERRFLAALESATTWSIEGDLLDLRRANRSRAMQAGRPQK